MRNIFVIALLLLPAVHSTFAQSKQTSNLTKDQIIDKYLKNGAYRYGIFSPEWQIYIDSAIGINPTIGSLYQQKAMPYFKRGKYEVGIEILDKAVEFDELGYIDYRAFMKCIFMKTHKDAIQDFIKSKEVKGEYGYVMDHSYNFYIGLSYLQLNEFEKAIEYFTRSIDRSLKLNGEKWVHHLDYFYLGIANQELQKHEKAIECFDKALTNYPEFSDAEYYKALSLYNSGKKDLVRDILKSCEGHFKSGYTINEANASYEKYPYQISQKDLDGTKGE